MGENYGGPVWHASGCGGTLRHSHRICVDGLHGVGDSTVGQWVFVGENPRIIHMIRRLTVAERVEFGVPEPYDIRGTVEERVRIASVYAEAPYLRAVMPA